MIVDGHAHIFPALKGRCGYPDLDAHLAVCQKAMHDHLSQPARSAVDNHIIRQKKLWGDQSEGPAARRAVDFHIAQYGRFEWNQDGEPCYLQYLPATLQAMECPPEMLLAQMDYVGIERAVLQCGGVYGELNEYYALTVSENPQAAKRFLPLARIREDRASTDEEITRLRHLVADWGLRGLWFAPGDHSFAPDFEPFWEEIASLEIPVYLPFFPERHAWLRSVASLKTWIKDHRNIPIVLPQAFPLSTVSLRDSVEIPDEVREVIETGRVLVELIYPIGRGHIEDYPFAVSNEAVRELYRTFGGSKLVWGSDIPMVERYCTYSQSLKHLTEYCDFISSGDLERILGMNLLEIFDR